MIGMAIEDEAKTQEAELIVRFLASDDNFGLKKSPHGVTRGLSDAEPKVYQQKVEKILSLLVSWANDIFGYEKIDRGSLFWIKTDKNSFITWFKEWFGKEFEE